MVATVIMAAVETFAGTGYPALSGASTAAQVPVSMFVVPGNDGAIMFSEAMAFGGQPVDATVTVYLIDAGGNPLVGINRVDVELRAISGNMVGCEYGVSADANSDENGMMMFSRYLSAGGYSEGLRVFYCGDLLLGTELDINVNSPDINADGRVDLSDVVEYQTLVAQGYSYRIDFYWGGVFNLSDQVLLGGAMGEACW